MLLILQIRVSATIFRNERFQMIMHQAIEGVQKEKGRLRVLTTQPEYSESLFENQMEQQFLGKSDQKLQTSSIGSPLFPQGTERQKFPRHSRISQFPVSRQLQTISEKSNCKWLAISFGWFVNFGEKHFPLFNAHPNWFSPRNGKHPGDQEKSKSLVVRQTYYFYCFPRSFVLLFPIVLHQLCLLHQVGAITMCQQQVLFIDNRNCCMEQCTAP